MAKLQVENFPPELLKQLKREALESDRSLRELVVSELSGFIERQAGLHKFVADPRLKGIKADNGHNGDLRVRRKVSRRRAPAVDSRSSADSPDLAAPLREELARLDSEIARVSHAPNCPCMVCKPPKA